MKKNRLFLFLASLSLLITGCKTGGVKCNAFSGDDPLDTPVTDSLKLAQANSLEGKKFASTSDDPSTYDHYGYVTLKSCTDGDTANFSQEGYVDEYNRPITIKTRFLGVNTPESTAKVEPWGKKASLFTKHQLEAAQAKADEESTCNIVLIADPDVHGVKDSSGGRWLAFVWYRLGSDKPWRNLNLELVEQAYSKNLLFEDSTMCNYRKAFEKAEENVSKCGYRVHGEIDSGYDYSSKTYEYSLWEIKKHYDKIGISESGSSGLQLIVTALIVGVQGDNLYLRDVLIPEEQYDLEGENAMPAGCYAYAGFGSALASMISALSKKNGGDGTGIGLVVRFYSRATIYSGNVQLSDLQTGSTGKKAFRAVTAENFDTYKESLSWSHAYQVKGADFSYADLNKDTTALNMDTGSPSIASTIKTGNGNEDCAYPDLLPYAGQWVKIELTIRTVTPSDDDAADQKDQIKRASGDSSSAYWYNPTANSKSYTVYSYFIGAEGKKVYCNIRVDTSLYPFVETSLWGSSDRYDASMNGKSFIVTGYLVRYFNKFQVQLGNNYAAYNYIQPVL